MSIAYDALVEMGGEATTTQVWEHIKETRSGWGNNRSRERVAQALAADPRVENISESSVPLWWVPAPIRIAGTNRLLEYRPNG